MLRRPGYISLLALIFGSLRMYRETNLFNVVDVWLRASYVSMIVRLCPVMDRFTIISRIFSGSDSSLTSSATSLLFVLFLVVLLHVVLLAAVVVVVILLVVQRVFQYS